MTIYKATSEQWEVQEKFAPESEDACCLLELRSRVERLELGAGIRDVVAKEVRRSLPEKSLVERVHSCIVGEPECGHMQARAAIREVAAWLRDYGGWNQSTAADVLEVVEAKR